MTIRTEIWIASHLHSQQRFEWAKSLVKSLAGLIIKPDIIYVSASKEQYVKGEMRDLFSHFPELNVCFFDHSTRLTQFQHLRHIHNSTKNDSDKGNTFVLFCDDDDMYHPSRIQRFMESATIHPEIDLFVDKSCIVDGSATLSDLGTTTEMRRDFGNYIIRRPFLTSFFDEEFDLDLLTGNYAGMADCAFMAWLHSFPKVLIDEELYYRRWTPELTMSRCWTFGVDQDFTTLVKPKGLDKVTYYH